ncbi:MAG: nitrous oxide reductase family maturation protein NosD [Flavobacteriaceae bacterium]|nr:nitrous oxide reductase family maturation protein NosD [Muriicola sp.]NNC61626.1 nitrous oxide reductase family maturation protein NosD [Eudoraea sp.]NNK21588.1 nitrous oxide reductase family maturation protein NosD [Flavobacteriaceae bacterium]MBT8290693.1 nitrous oxide reductase family maturation protein NosD [Muriicola sp.]NNK35892.1 nitrous oxide reductase family maturation protein NosD [Eudoraea sp.]
MRQIIIIFLTCLFVSLSGLKAQSLVICDQCELKTIKEGIAVAQDHDTLLIRKGTYREFNILIDKPLTLLGVDSPVIDGQDKGEIFRIVSDSVTIDGLSIINVGTSYTSDYAAIRVVKSDHFAIRNVVLEKLFFGIYLERSNNGIVSNNKILGDAQDEYNSGNGIQLWYSKNVVVEGNIVQGVRDGIYLEFADNISISKNHSRDNLRYGLHFMFSNDDSYEDNIFENNGAGVAVMFSKRIKMERNIFRRNWGTASFGLLLKEINDAEILGNTFEKNTIGINVEGSNRINYLNNNFVENGWAVKIMGACYTNTFRNNNFIYNSFDISYNSKLNDNVFDQNYWSDYTGYDLDRDGIGDVPYRPVKLFSYIVNRSPETIVLLRSLFMDIIDFSEKVSPVFTPDKLADTRPLMKKKI